ncbi:MAG: T9SS type A sorting domain-containing protein [Candidatus Cloacimonetes bacterium]|nr:T9SS type A sorting domain-containing protein [Candidatus Cloacimonadota bacterium]
MKKTLLILLTLTLLCVLTAREWIEWFEPFPEIPIWDKSNIFQEIIQCHEGGYAVLSEFCWELVWDEHNEYQYYVHESASITKVSPGMEIQWSTIEEDIYGGHLSAKGLTELSDHGFVTIMEDNLVKYDGHGNFEWSVHIGYDISEPKVVCAYSDGGMIVAGYYGSPTTYLLNLMRLDNDGNIIWTREADYWLPEWDVQMLDNMFLSSDDTFYVAGNLTDTWSSEYQTDKFPMLLAFDENGDTLYTKLITEVTTQPKYSYEYSVIAETPKNGIAMLALQFGLETGNRNARLFQFDYTGAITGSKFYPGFDNGWKYFGRLNNGKYVAFGGTDEGQWSESWSRCFNSDFDYIGNYLWPVEHDEHTSGVRQRKLFPHGSGFITGGSNNPEFWIAYENSFVPVSNDEFVVPTQHKINISPNPFNPDTSLEFTLTQPAYIELSVFNIKGQLVKTLVNQRLQSGVHKINWDGKDNSNHPSASGIYFFKLKYGGKTSIQKATLLK